MGLFVSDRVLILLDRVAAFELGNGKEHIHGNLVRAHCDLGWSTVVGVLAQPFEFASIAANSYGAFAIDVRPSRVSNAKISLGQKLFYGASEIQIASAIFEAASRDVAVSGPYDAVLVSLYEKDAPALAAMALKQFGLTKRVILWEHRSHYLSPPRNPITRFRLLRRRRDLFKWCDAAVAISDSLARLMERAMGLRLGLVKVVPNVVSSSFFSEPVSRSLSAKVALPAEKFVFAAQNFTRPIKGFRTLLKSIESIGSRRRDIRFKLAGTFPSWFDDWIAASDCSDMVEVLGRVPHEDMPGLLSRARLSVISSRTETFSNPAAEALASGVPVVSTVCGGPESFIVDGLHGRLVERDRPDLLAQAIEQVWDRREDFDSEKLLAYAMERFGFPGWSRYWRSLYESLGVRRDG